MIISYTFCLGNINNLFQKLQAIWKLVANFARIQFTHIG